MRTVEIAVVEDTHTLDWLADTLRQASADGRTVRFSVQDGLRGGLMVAVGAGVWTFPMGRMADSTGH